MALAVDPTTGGNSTASTTGTTALQLIMNTTLFGTNGGVVIATAVTECLSSAGAYAEGTSVIDTTNSVTYQLRNRFTLRCTGDESQYVCMEIWYGIYTTATNLNNAGVTWTESSATPIDDMELGAIAVAGFTGTAWQTNPWDQAAATAAGWVGMYANGAATDPTSANFSTVNANSMVLCFAGSGTSGSTGGYTFVGDTATIAGTSGIAAVLADHVGAGTYNATLGVYDLVVSSVQSNIDEVIPDAFLSWIIAPDVLSQTGFSGAAPFLTIEANVTVDLV